TDTVTTAPTRRRLRNIFVRDTDPFDDVTKVRDLGHPLPLHVTSTFAPAGASVTRRLVNLVDFDDDLASNATKAETRPAASAPEQSWSSPSPTTSVAPG